jgi:hypothetical protein
MINHVQIDLRLAFKENIERARKLFVSPEGHADEEMETALRRLYEKAHGRSVQTTVGLIPIAPAIAPCLSRRTFSVATRSELLTAIEHHTALNRELY